MVIKYPLGIFSLYVFLVLTNDSVFVFPAYLNVGSLGGK